MSQVVARNLGVETALHEAEQRFLEANPSSRARHEDARKSLPGGNTRTVLHYPPFPLTVARGEGAYVWDLDGHCYVDFLCEYSAGLYGHSNPVIRAAVEKALADGVVLGGPNAYEARFAEALTSRFPSLEFVRFCNSGTEASLFALSTARAAKRREKILAFEGAYHGGVFLYGHGGSPLNTPFPVVFARYNDAAAAVAHIDRHKDELAAVIVEPMLGAGGCIPSEPAFLAALREATARHGIVLIFDEVITSRLSPSGLQGAFGVTPDMTVLGKYLGGGLTFGAFGGRADIMERFDPSRPDAFPHAGTFNNNVLTMAAGLTGLTEVFSPDAAKAINARGESLRGRLNAAIAARGFRSRVTGYGSVMAVHFVEGPVRAPEDLAVEDERLHRLFHFDMLARGQYLSPRGMIALSLPMGDAELDGLVAALEAFLDDYAPLLAAA